MTLYEGALWMKAHLPPNTRVGSFDAGIVGYFSELPVTNLDGLVNSVSFIPYALGDSVYRYLKKEGIAYLAQFFRGGIYEDGRLAGSRSEWEALLGDTLYMRPFIYSSTGIFSAVPQIQSYFMILKLQVEDHPSSPLLKKYKGCRNVQLTNEQIP
ncbi:MAG: hypothetical protein N3E49_03430 [Bacteroidia bacterium]|nr:hypothetical protein [Bacteroidia bacterium]